MMSKAEYYRKVYITFNQYLTMGDDTRKNEGTTDLGLGNLGLRFLSFLLSQVNAAVDMGKHQDYSIAEVEKKIREDKLIDDLRNDFGENVDFSICGKDSNLEKELNKILKNFFETDKKPETVPDNIKNWDCKNSGLHFLLMCINDIIKRLECEYIELCKDWRSRDKYVLDKLSATGILFVLLGLAMATVPQDDYLTRFILGFMGTLFSFILCLSIYKDIYYRDGTEKLIKCLSEWLGVRYSLHIIGCSNGYENKLKFTRKVRKEEGHWLGKIFRGLPTFWSFLFFYVVLFLIFLIFLISTFVTLRNLYAWDIEYFKIALVICSVIVIIFLHYVVFGKRKK